MEYVPPDNGALVDNENKKAVVFIVWLREQTLGQSVINQKS